MRNAREQSVPQIQIVSFRVGAEEFGLDVFTVHEILRHQEVTPVPKAPEFVEGVIDVRGSLVPILDLRRRFELSSAEIGNETRIVVVQFGGERLGLVVDAVLEVMRVPETAVSPPPAYFKGIAAEFMRGIVRLEGRLVVLMDVDRILSSQERIALDESELTGSAATSDSPEGE